MPGPGSIKSLKRRPSAKSAAKRIGRMFKRTNSGDSEATTPATPGLSKDSFDGSRVSTSSRFSISSRMTTREDADVSLTHSNGQPRPFASRLNTEPPKERDVVPPHPFFSSNSEPFLEHGKAVGPVTPVGSPLGSPMMIESEALPSPVYSEAKEQTKMIGEQPEPVSTPKPEPRPLPTPPIKKVINNEPESPVLPRKEYREEPQQVPKVPQPAFKPEQKFETETKSQAAPTRKSTVPPPTVEDEPEAVVEPVKTVKEQPKTRTKTEGKQTQHRVERKTEHQTHNKEEKQTVEPMAQPKTAYKKSTPVQSPPIVPTSSASVASSSAPNTAPTLRYTITSDTSSQISRDIFVPKTAPAPYTARAPITAPAPIIAAAPKMVMSILAWAIPEPAPIPRIASMPQQAHSPSTSLIRSSA
ncbi:hypothetical protein F53441_6188 [Fusarium austroafricanum]|uniref:Uncharacterized protein n=1 Tax=Fusarium austroafricanum TaxID=2364996 RepID=A0A8H4KGA2_9HYPO|nr:hypothetical protein F53441_6188 [Fusarium austroafricanum]